MRRLHYAWVVVLAAGVANIVSATASYAFGLFLVPISQDMGWSRGQVSMVYALQFLTFAATALGAGWMADRFGLRKVLLPAAGLFAAGLLLAGTSHSLWQLYLSFGVMLGASRSVFVAPVHTAIGYWFNRRLGLAMGLVAASIGLGPLLFSPLVRYLIGQWGWGPTLMAIGLVGGAFLILACLFIRGRPEEMGLLPYGAAPSIPGDKGVQTGVFYQGQEDFFRHARRTRPFWMLPAIHSLGCISHAIPLAHLAALAEDRGIAPVTAASILGFATGISVISRLGISLLAAQSGGKKSLVLALALQGSSMFLLLGARDPGLFYLYGLVFGLGYGGEMVNFPILNRQYYGNAPTGAIYGVQMLGAGLGMALGGYLGGFLFDLMGDYGAAVWVSIVMAYLGVLLALRLPSPLPTASRRGELDTKAVASP